MYQQDLSDSDQMVRSEDQLDQLAGQVGQMDQSAGQMGQSDQISDDQWDCLWCCKPNCQNKCPKCGLVAYCSADHLQNHYGANDICYPWRIRQSDQKGRYTQAVRDIKPTELIIKDLPLVIGPSR